MPHVNVRFRCAKNPDAVEIVHVQVGASWDTLQSALVSHFSINLTSAEELYCVFINSFGKVASPVICQDGGKFWRTYGNKYSSDTTDSVLFEVNTRQSRAANTHPPGPLTPSPQYPVQQQQQLSSVQKITQSISSPVPVRHSPAKADIHSASKAGNLSTVQSLIKHHASTVNARDDLSSTPLHYAAENGHLPLVTFLISQKAFKNNRNSSGRTPLLSAVACGHLEVVKYLVGERAFTFVLDNEGNGPLHLAAKYNHPHILEWLLCNGGIDKSLRNSKGETFSACIPPGSHGSTAGVTAQPATAATVSKHSNEVLQWRLVGAESGVRQDKLAVLADLDLASWQSFCFCLLTLFNIEGITNYMIKDKVTKKYLVKPNEDIYRAVPTLVEYIVLVEHDGDEGSGHVKDLPKFFKILNKIYRADDDMTFVIHLNCDILKKYQKSFQKEAENKILDRASGVSSPRRIFSPPHMDSGETTSLNDGKPLQWFVCMLFVEHCYIVPSNTQFSVLI
jgi:ankyrin repeat protein